MITTKDKSTQITVHIDGFDPTNFGLSTNGNIIHSNVEQWPSPKPLTTNLREVLPLDPDMIPEPLRAWLTDISNRMKCPLDFVVTCAIVMVSSLIGTRLTIKPKSRDDWTICPNLWGAIVGDPSSMKTPSMNEVFKPLNQLIVEARKIQNNHMLEYEAQLLTCEVQKKVFQSNEINRLRGKSVENPVNYPQQPAKPIERRYMTNDATVEKIAELLNENPAGLIQYRDELIGMLAGWERSGREQDRAFYLEAWNGTGSMTIDRIGRGTIYIPHICLSLFGGIQPTKLSGYLKSASEYENDGFVQRLQMAVYPDKASWSYVDEYPDKWARDSAYILIRKIAESDFSLIGYDANEYNRYPYTRFDDAAQAVFKEWLTEWESVTLPKEEGLLEEHFTKYRSLIPSLALIFHVINCEALPIDKILDQKYLVSKEALSMAIRWCNYLMTHARRIYGLLDSLSMVSAKELLRHLKKGQLKSGFKAREIRQKDWANLSTAEAVDSALTELTTYGYLKEIAPPVPTNGRPESPTYLIHPELISNNAE